jgi:hypothetical protein
MQNQGLDCSPVTWTGLALSTPLSDYLRIVDWSNDGFPKTEPVIYALRAYDTDRFARILLNWLFALSGSGAARW